MRGAIPILLLLIAGQVRAADAADRAWKPEDARWPDPRRAPNGVPNVLIVLWDDVGFGQFGCYGSPLATPTVDRLAAGGIRYTNFHVNPVCSPTRAALQIGRAHV